MAIEITTDPHDPEDLFLLQYKNSPNFKLFVESFLQPIMVELETQFQLFLNDRSIQNATGKVLKSWMEILTTNFTYTDDEDLRRKLWIRVSELFSVGSVYDVQDFFQKYYRAFKVDVIELGSGKIDLEVYGGISPPPGTSDFFKVFPAGLCQINQVRFLDDNIIFSFASDERPFSLGYGIVDLAAGSYYPYVWPTDLSVSDRIRLQYQLIGSNLNVWIIFTVNNADAAGLVSILQFEIFDVYDKNGTLWNFRGTATAIPGGTVTTAANGALTDVKVQLCYDNAAIIKVGVSGTYVRYQDMNAGGVGFSAFSGFTSSDQTVYNEKNPNGITLGFSETIRAGIGGRLSITN